MAVISRRTSARPAKTCRTADPDGNRPANSRQRGCLRLPSPSCNLFKVFALAANGVTSSPEFSYRHKNVDSCLHLIYNATNGRPFSRALRESLVASRIGTSMSDVTQILPSESSQETNVLPMSSCESCTTASPSGEEATGPRNTGTVVPDNRSGARGLSPSGRVGSRLEGPGPFVAAAAEAMRRILVERARKKRRIKHGGLYTSVELSHATVQFDSPADEVIMVSDLLESLAKQHPLGAQIVKLRYFAGLNISEAGKTTGMSSSAAHRHWTFARAWLYEAIRNEATKRKP